MAATYQLAFVDTDSTLAIYYAIASKISYMDYFNQTLVQVRIS